MHYVKDKREKIDKCNICLEEKALSWDHIPPKGSIETTPVEMDSLFQALIKDTGRKLKESQNGMKLRTICRECNSKLGTKYDTIIKEFSLSVGRYLTSNFQFPDTIHHSTKPIPLMKGILGHLVASKMTLDDAYFDDHVREILFDDTKTIPETIKIFYWLYPYEQIVIMRDFAIPSVRGNFKNFGVFQMLKFFPIAYLVSDVTEYEGLHELSRYRELRMDEVVEIPIQLNRVEHPLWPEMVDDRNILLGGQGSMDSILAKKRNR